MNLFGATFKEDRIPEFFAVRAQLLLPFLPTPEKLIIGILDRLNPPAGSVLYDLGCGDGRVLEIAAAKYGMKAVGFEINRALFDSCKERIGRLPRRVARRIKVYRKDFMTISLKKADYVFMYVTPDCIEYMRGLISTARKGAVMIFVKYLPRGDFLASTGLKHLTSIEWEGNYPITVGIYTKI